VKQAVLLLSSGLDSAANLALGRVLFEIKLALSIDYGQKSAAQELRHAAALSRYFGIEHVVLSFPGFSEVLAAGRGGALLDQGASIPRPDSLDDLSVTQKTAKQVWVPNRNGFFINVAATLAESRGLDALVVGFNREEAATFPDNGPEFMRAATEALRYSTQNQVEVMSATVGMNKLEIVQALSKAAFPFEMLWSCYRNEAVHCGKCESCLRLERALVRGVEDQVTRAQVLEQIFGKREAAC